MRLGKPILGVYMQYLDSAQPVETFDRKVYSFDLHNDRICLVNDIRHIAMLLARGSYNIVDVEYEGGQTLVHKPDKVEEKSVKPKKPKRRR